MITTQNQALNKWQKRWLESDYNDRIKMLKNFEETISYQEATELLNVMQRNLNNYRFEPILEKVK